MNIEDIQLSVDGNICIATIANKAYRVNSLFYRILCNLKSGLSVEDSVNLVSAETGINHDLLFDKFSSFIKSVQRIKAKTYIRCRFVVIREKWVNKISRYLVFLYSKYVFTTLFLASMITNAVYLGLKYNHLGDSSYQTVKMGAMVFVGYMLSLIVHEIGHATATASLGKKAKEIGFGFYLIFPVFYTDVTSAWNMRKKERILVNFGGVYFQVLLNAIVIGLILVFPMSATTKALHTLVLSNIFVVIMSMTPFFRNDGYWVISDYWSIPNLLKRSDEALLCPGRLQNENSKNEKYKLLIFGLANNMFRIYVFVRLALNLRKNLVRITDMQTQNEIMVIAISTLFSFIGMCWILMCYCKIFRHGNQDRY